MNVFGENIKTCRERRNMSLEELALKMRVGPQRIEAYESGKLVPSNETILRLSTILDIPAAELLGHEYPVKPEDQLN